MSHSDLSRSSALWNRRTLDLRSSEQLAQILNRGTMQDWRSLYALASHDQALRARIVRVIETVPLPLPRFWLAAMAALEEHVDFDADLPSYPDEADI